jgi:glutaminyl-tRNA synthetase
MAATMTNTTDTTTVTNGINSTISVESSPVPVTMVLDNETETTQQQQQQQQQQYQSAALNARELEWAINSTELLHEHQSINQSIVRTRFPPEPNGYLHIGHAKSMNMNFRLAFDKLRVPIDNRRTIFRYDDTNPDAESMEYIDSLMRDCTWLGWEPERVTYSSDNFTHLYTFAMHLIEKGLAYVCDMTKLEMETQRELAMKRANAVNTGKDPDVIAPISSSDVLPGRNRETSIERNQRLFEQMKLGMFDEGTYTLRLKMDFSSSNPNLYDLVAYRIKYTQHPHAGHGWCIYPSYDFTHGICDSLEHIDYSICTLEFEARREPYYWILHALNLYRPKVYEMSRLNVSYTVLSKRKLIKLVDAHIVRGWDDPRMPTISGLRRRGYTPTILNTFCQDVGATRAANVVEMDKLHQTARLGLAPTSIRVMAALTPIKVILTNYLEAKMEALSISNEPQTPTSESTMEGNNSNPFSFIVQNIATDESAGSHTITLTNTIYIDASDFRLNDTPEYYGLAPNKSVGLKYYGGNLICDTVIYTDSSNVDITELHCRIELNVNGTKPKTYLSWVPDNSITAEVRVYNNLFTVPEPSDLWEEELNPQSEVVYTTAMIDPSIYDFIDGTTMNKWQSNRVFQFERLGYFVIDYDTTYDPNTKLGHIVFNRTVSLKEEVFKKVLTEAEKTAVADRVARSQQSVAAKDVRMMIDPINLFREAEEYHGKFSQYSSTTGIPHDIDGTELTKTMMKKLDKEQQKHVKQVMKWKQNQDKK